jgi:hypothetical protein
VDRAPPKVRGANVVPEITAELLSGPDRRFGSLPPFGPTGPQTSLSFSEALGFPRGPREQPADLEQRPAAYRFTWRDDKIEVLPEVPEPQDRAFAIDTYDELVRKTRELQQRMEGTNSAPRASRSISRLRDVLGARFDDLREAVLLSSLRSVEADLAAFSGELSADAIAMMADTGQTLRDLLAAFPKVRAVETQRVALDLDRNPDAIPAVRQHMAAIKAAAAKSGVATEATISALGYNDAAIEDAADPVERTGLIGYSLLVYRNFVGVVAGAIGKATPELCGLGADAWKGLGSASVRQRRLCRWWV